MIEEEKIAKKMEDVGRNDLQLFFFFSLSLSLSLSLSPYIHHKVLLLRAKRRISILLPTIHHRREGKESRKEGREGEEGRDRV